MVLPDYQGIGIGSMFLDAIAKEYAEQGYQFRIVTSAKNMIWKLYKSPKWACVRYDVSSCKSAKSKLDNGRASIRNQCKTAGFRYIG